jgi:hypothetical protein
MKPIRIWAGPALLLAASTWLISCKKDAAQEMAPINKAPVVDAGGDTAIYNYPGTFLLIGRVSDPDNNVQSFHWRQVSGPSTIQFSFPDKALTSISGLVKLGVYEFELTAEDAGNLISKDSVRITVMADPHIVYENGHVIFKEQKWNYSWIIELDIYNIDSYLPPNATIQNVSIKRENSVDWETVIPVDQVPSDYTDYYWMFGSKGLIIFQKETDRTDDTPDIKIEY